MSTSAKSPKAENKNICSYIYIKGSAKGDTCSCYVTKRDPKGLYCSSHYKLKMKSSIDEIIVEPELDDVEQNIVDHPTPVLQEEFTLKVSNTDSEEELFEERYKKEWEWYNRQRNSEIEEKEARDKFYSKNLHYYQLLTSRLKDELSKLKDSKQN